MRDNKGDTATGHPTASHNQDGASELLESRISRMASVPASLAADRHSRKSEHSLDVVSQQIACDVSAASGACALHDKHDNRTPGESGHDPGSEYVSRRKSHTGNVPRLTLSTDCFSGT